ncbi:MAG: MotA/TolQ/ExbB proton channel family protein [Bacteroidaceae bacterium]|jgi:biopolymer transport protein ExbB|nr:MotA/TolQ/ExbB proton channel family protein [Bacteroidaceae bacterium]MBO7558301.1 MotA/TolQ/ExbB proton channel family protein [Bacteroidaceae bacterium]MBQ2166962.1 MotA/TolQ/ExbB proton channel family protein [Bacteroidaceae bacterium]MBQ2181220.1 MotA/TolQ/ExbB proton channel family protein [Bacteroidaceae bacterium]MBQ2340578.1 MotA/TolQ/ExbB proton channel family protein [Bacteroidaceae bacterium]
MNELSILELCKQGGWIMIVLAILSIIAIYIFVERFIAIRAAEKDDPLFMDRIRDYLKGGDVKSAINFCRVTNTPGARLIERGISRMNQAAPEIQTAIENTGNLEVAALEKRIHILATIAGGAPMIGFLGTVIGMVQAFWQMSNAGGNLDISMLSGGIYQAMITTVGGLIVGIVALFAHNYLVAKIDGVVNELERKTLTFMDIMNEE